MRSHLVLVTLALLAPAARAADARPPTSSPPPLSPELRAQAGQVREAALADERHGWARLAELTDTFGNRFSGSASLEAAIDWILKQMQLDGLSNVHGEPISVPHWVRGAESLEITGPVQRALPVLGLGDSVATPAEGITAPILVVTSFADLHQRATEARGRIVVWNVPFTEYRETVAYRSMGAVETAKVGGVASLVRSVTPVSQRTLHTGGMHYEPGVAQIPAAAITVEDAEMLQRMQDRGETPVLRLKMNDQLFPDARSRNVIAEIPGREHPEEVVIVSGHIDSWDVGAGAMDDGGGAVAAWEAVNVIRQLGLRPRRTIRVVLWTNEENGLHGGLGYRDAHKSEVDHHVVAIESDNGVFQPRGFRFSGSEAGLAVAQSLAPLLAPIDAGAIVKGESEADVSPLVELGVPAFGLAVEGAKYFWYHHTAADTIDKLDPREMAHCIAALAVLTWAIAEMPGEIPRK